MYAGVQDNDVSSLLVSLDEDPECLPVIPGDTLHKLLILGFLVLADS